MRVGNLKLKAGFRHERQTMNNEEDMWHDREQQDFMQYTHDLDKEWEMESQTIKGRFEALSVATQMLREEIKKTILGTFTKNGKTK